jgi:hypothetical protein
MQRLLRKSEKAQKVMWGEENVWWTKERRRQVHNFYEKSLKKLIEQPKDTLNSKESITLQKRFKKHHNKIFHFLTDPHIPHHNNSSEQAIRNTKIHKKVSGCFRSDRGAERHASLLTFIETVKKHKRPVLESLQLVLRDQFSF